MNLLSELGPAALRVRRGFERVVLRRRPVTPGHEDNARETNVMLRLMREASEAPAPTFEQQIFLADAAVGMRNRVTFLLGIPNRSLAEERELTHISTWLAEDAQRRAAATADEPITLVSRQTGGFSGNRLLSGLSGPWGAVLASPVTWVALAFALPAAGAMIQTARLNHAKHELTQTRDDLEQAIHERNDWHDRASRYAQAVTDARETAEQTAQALNQERRRRAAAARVEAERQRNVQSVLADSLHSDPPAWDERLRNDQPLSE